MHLPWLSRPISIQLRCIGRLCGECTYLAYECSSLGDDAWMSEAMGLFPDWQAMHGIAWEGEWVFNIPESIIEPGSGVSMVFITWIG